MANTVFDFLKQFGMHEALEHAIKSVFDLGVEKVKEGIQSKNFGLGVNDELLFLSACYVAKKDLGVSDDGILLVCRAIDTLAPGDRKRIIRMIGHDEQATTLKTPLVHEKTGDPLLDKKGSPIYKEKSIVENTRGAMIIKMLADLNDTNKILEVFKSVGVDGLSDTNRILSAIKRMASGIVSSDAVQGLKSNAGQSLTKLEDALNTPNPIGSLINFFTKN